MGGLGTVFSSTSSVVLDSPLAKSFNISCTYDSEQYSTVLSGVTICFSHVVLSFGQYIKLPPWVLICNTSIPELEKARHIVVVVVVHLFLFGSLRDNSTTMSLVQTTSRPSSMRVRRVSMRVVIITMPASVQRRWLRRPRVSW